MSTDIIVLFSRLQLEKDKELYTKAGKTYVNKYVIVKGKPVQYTDIVTDESLSKFNDSIVVIRGAKSSMTFINK
jgi:hypothetical protein